MLRALARDGQLLLGARASCLRAALITSGAPGVLAYKLYTLLLSAANSAFYRLKI